MQIDEIRIYSGCLEQGLDFKTYLLGIDSGLLIKNIYPTKSRQELKESDSILQKITKFKDFDIIISLISQSKEIPILLVEYSTAVPTDDHKMQRSDVYFWAGIFKIPVLKISSLSKNSSSNHGGGDKISLAQEISLTLKKEAVVYFIDWQSNEHSILIANKDSLSCIDTNEQLKEILANLLNKCKMLADFNAVYQSLLQEQSKFFNAINLQNLKNVFVDSTRFQRIDDEIIVKINRFGHAMDPDRGILYFVSQLFGLENVVTKFIVKRERMQGKESYKTLFDGLSNNLQERLNHLITKPFNANLALEIFTTATGIELDFIKVDSTHYKIADENLKKFLQSYTSITFKAIFLNSSKLWLCDYNNNLICEISWSADIVINYLKSLNTSIYTPLPLSNLSFQTAKEDLITYASVQLLKRANCEILAVSYPDAQGDKAILIGQGRATKRIYLDIIAASEQNAPLKIAVILQENKEKYVNLKEDEAKLLDLRQNHISPLNVLLQKLSAKKDIAQDDIYLGLGSKYAKTATPLNVDYIFAFDIKSNDTQTIIYWNVAVINFDLCNIFKPLLNAKNKLCGKIVLDLIYKA